MRTEIRLKNNIQTLANFLENTYKRRNRKIKSVKLLQLVVIKSCTSTFEKWAHFKLWQGYDLYTCLLRSSSKIGTEKSRNRKGQSKSYTVCETCARSAINYTGYSLGLRNLKPNPRVRCNHNYNSFAKNKLTLSSPKS